MCTFNSCNIVKDFKTGNSLCYAFIEFETKEECEKAYFKMNNVLIDDRRIKVRAWKNDHNRCNCEDVDGQVKFAIAGRFFTISEKVVERL